MKNKDNTYKYINVYCTPPLYVLMFYCLRFDPVVRNNYSVFIIITCFYGIHLESCHQLIGMSLTSCACSLMEIENRIYRCGTKIKE